MHITDSEKDIRARKKRAEYMREYNRMHPEKAREVRRRRFEKNPNYNAEYRALHPEAAKKKSKRWYDTKGKDYYKRYRKENPGKAEAIISRWKKNNRDKLREYNRRRRARVFNAEGSFTEKEWRVLLEEHDGGCAHCGTKEKITKDHIIPISRGGSDYISNIQPLCLSCNCRKAVKTKDGGGTT